MPKCKECYCKDLYDFEGLLICPICNELLFYMAKKIDKLESELEKRK